MSSSATPQILGGGRVKRSFMFTSESVTEGHPDKLCDQISDAVLDAALAVDPNAKVACETCAAKNLVMIFGEIAIEGGLTRLNLEQIARETVRQIGYDDEAKGLDYRTMEVVIAMEVQSPEIAAGVYINKKKEDIGAGDQGHVFGYACEETPQYMPMSHSICQRLAHRLAECRKQNVVPHLRPDGKTQVTMLYQELENGKVVPVNVHTIVVSAQHDAELSLDKLREQIKEHVIKPVVPAELLTGETKYYINPCGHFIIGGPKGDSGLTGRKIIVDTYGGWGSHGGGAFSGKDSTKVDRSAAYMARHIAKSLVANKFCNRCLVQISYAIGISTPLSVYVNTYGTVAKGYTEAELEELVVKYFDLRPGKIIEYLKLTQPNFQKTAAYGHFGRDGFLWENVRDLSAELCLKAADFV